MPRTLNPAESGIQPQEFVEQAFSMSPTADGSCHRAKTMESESKMKDEAHKHPLWIKFE